METAGQQSLPSYQYTIQNHKNPYQKDVRGLLSRGEVSDEIYMEHSRKRLFFSENRIIIESMKGIREGLKKSETVDGEIKNKGSFRKRKNT